MQPRVLLALLAVTAGGLAFLAHKAAPPPAPAGHGYTPPLDLDSMPGIPFACITPMPLGHKPPEEYHWLIDARLSVSADLRYLEVESHWGSGRVSVRRWDLLTGQYAGERESDPPHRWSGRNRYATELLSADGRTRIECAWPTPPAKHTARVARTDGSADPSLSPQTPATAT